MLVKFVAVTVLESRQGTSHAGNTYCALRFLTSTDLLVYDCMQFGDSASLASGLVKGSVVDLDFEIVPGRDGGVRLVLVGVGKE